MAIPRRSGQRDRYTPPVPAPRCARWLALALLLLTAGSASAESALRLPMPSRFGAVPASTYDEEGNRVGSATIVVERLDDGRVRMLGESGFDGAARNVVTAEFDVVDEGSALQLLRQTSRSFDHAGQPLGQLSIDHLEGVGTCSPPNGGDARTRELGRRDKVANIPVNLLFMPLAQGTRESVEFQVFLCTGKPRVVDAKASVARRVETADGLRDIVEVRYDMDWGPVLSRLARPFMPKVAVWFDPKHPEGWLAHRMPLFAKGPTVMVVRTGIPPQLLNLQ